MRRARAPLTAFVLALGLMLSGCESMDPDNWFNPKKPLPGERKAVFPQGTPGVPQGVPPELMQGYQPPPEPEPAAKPVAQPEKPKPRPRRVATPARPASQAGDAPWPAPGQQQTQSAPWPDPPSQSTSQPAQQAPSPWPDPPRPGTFSR